MPYYERTFRFGFGGGLTTAVKYLLIINASLYFLKVLLPPEFFGWAILTPSSVVTVKSHFWQLFTYMFLHDTPSPWHMLFNMFWLWMFGCEVERSLGTREFTKYYIICGIGAGILQLIMSDASVIGASGAVFGVMAAFAILFPERVITLLLFFILPVQVKAKYLVMFFAGISLLMGVLGQMGASGNVAHFAHLGGMAVGFAYLKLDWRLDYFGKLIRRRRESNRAVQNIKKQQAMQTIREQVDEILDKINEVGYEGLNAEEKRILQDASEKFGQEKEAEN